MLGEFYDAKLHNKRKTPPLSSSLESLLKEGTFSMRIEGPSFVISHICSYEKKAHPLVGTAPQIKLLRCIFMYGYNS